VPDPPQNLQNIAFSYSSPDTTTDTQIRFTWEDGPSDGGASVLDYDVYYDQGSQTASYILLQPSIISKEWTTTNTLVAGETYSFRVSARNSVGEGAKSDPLSVYAATIPDAPLSV